MATKTKEQKPLTIEIHGQGLDVKATFSEARKVGTGLRDIAEAVLEQLGGRSAAARAATRQIPVDHQHDIALALEFVYENLAATPTPWLGDTAQRIKREIERRMAGGPIQIDPSTTPSG